MLTAQKKEAIMNNLINSKIITEIEDLLQKPDHMLRSK